jgi:hypothetical protein
VEFRQRGAVPLEQSGVSPEGGWGPNVLVGRWGPQDREPLFAICDCLGMSFVGEFVYVSLFAKESGFSLVI